MIDCNITENFFHELKRMCKSTGCIGCGISIAKNVKLLTCEDYCRAFPKEAIADLQSWSNAHPQKTYSNDFVEKFPNAPLKDNGIPMCCPYYLGYCEDRECCGNCKACWNRPLTEDTEC